MFIILLLIKRFVYFQPSGIIEKVPEHYENLFIPSLELHGYFIQGNNGKAILFCHGNAGNASNRQYQINELNKLGYSVMIFDYSGYGLSKGVPTEQNLYRDGSLFMEKLLLKYPAEDIILYGNSLGGPVAMFLAIKYKIDKVILVRPLPSIKRIIQMYPILSWLSFMFDEFDTESFIKTYNGKIMLMIGQDDEIIPHNITNVLQQYSNIIILLNGNHNYMENIPWEHINNFIKN